MSKREVTEADFRMPEYRNAEPEDYEFRPDGALARKDRWQTAVTNICSIVGLDVRSFEIPEVVEAVKALTDSQGNWISADDAGLPFHGQCVHLKLADGSILRYAETIVDSEIGSYQWEWRCAPVEGVVAWQPGVV